jgi:hypothetical protein
MNSLLSRTIILAALTAGASAQDQKPAPPHDTSNMPGMAMPNGDKTSAPEGENAGAAQSMTLMDQTSMDHRHMDMGPHMKMTALRDPKPGDADRAAKVAETARLVADKYTDYHTALNGGFKIFLPEVPQKQYHFTNYKYAAEAAAGFNPEHPTSLLYEKEGDGYKLVGVMYTAPKRLSEDDLDQRIPLSIAQWHEHVNFCAPPASMSPDEKRVGLLGPNAKFGLRGSIATEEACDAAGGKFHPVIFNWMVHLYPMEKTPDAIWSAERGHDHGNADGHSD